MTLISVATFDGCPEFLMCCSSQKIRSRFARMRGFLSIYWTNLPTVLLKKKLIWVKLHNLTKLTMLARAGLTSHYSNPGSLERLGKKPVFELNFIVLFEEWFIPSLFLALVLAQLIKKLYWLRHCPCWFQQVHVNEIFSSLLSIIWDRFSFIFLLVTLKIEELYCKSSLSNLEKGIVFFRIVS